MEEYFTVYYCSVCHVCKKPSESSKSMKFCSGCKLIQYCSIEHQKRDWPNHRELCKIVKHITKKNNKEHFFQDVHLFGSLGNLLNWNSLRISLVTLLENIWKRPLTNIEMQMLHFPPVCNHCHLYKVNTMFICHLCKSVMYCSKEHQLEDKKHSSICKLFALSFEVDMLRFHKQATIFELVEFAILCGVKKLPKNMESFIKSLTSTLTTKGICLSELLSYTLTLIYVIIKVAKITTNELTLHIVGADSMDLLAMQTFLLVYHLLPHIIHLKIVIIGPSVSDVDSIPLFIADSNITLCSVNLWYHEYEVSSKFVAPDIIAALNCGFCEFTGNPNRDTWKQSLSSIMRFKNTVVAITSCTKKESVVDLDRLLSFKPKDVEYNILIKCGQNPFCSLYPHREWENGGVYFANNYISVIKT